MASESHSLSSHNGEGCFRADALLPPTVDFESLRRYTFGGLVGFEELLAPVLPHFAGRRIEANRDVRARCTARFSDGFENHLDSFLVRLSIAAKS
jgi:hypothetical protein